MDETTGERLAQFVATELTFHELAMDIEPLFAIEEMMVGWR